MGIVVPPVPRTDSKEELDLWLDRVKAKVNEVDTSVGNLTTSDIPEGSNKYYTDERVDDRVATLIINGNALVWTYDDANNTLKGDVTKASASPNASQSSVSITSADADLTYDANEMDLLNELKADVNQLVADLNNVVNSLNDLKQRLRDANLLS